MLIVAGGVIVSFLSWSFLRSQEQTAIADEFALASDNYVYAVRKEIGANLKALEVLKTFLETNEVISPASFQQFAGSLRQSFPSIMVLEWAPRIGAAQRPGFEQMLRTSGNPYPFVKNDLKIPPARAPQRVQYLPLAMLSPAGHEDQLLGYDLGSTPDVGRAVQLALDTHQLVAGGAMRLIEQTNGGSGIPVYLAAYDTRGPEKLRPRGIALGIFQLATVLENGLKSARREPANIAFWDLSARGGRRRIYFHGEDSTLSPDDFIPNLADRQPALKQIATFGVGSRQWAMVLRPTARYLAQRKTHRAEWLLMGELLMTAFTAICFFLSSMVLRRQGELKHFRSLKDAQDGLRRSEERYAIAVRGANDGLWDWDPASDVLYVSDRWREMVGLGDTTEVSITFWLSLVHPADRTRVENEFQHHLSGASEFFESEYRILHADGAYRWVRSRGVAVRAADRSPTRVAGSLTDITATKVLDPLTRLPNRLCFADKLEAVDERFRRDRSRQFALIFIDLDRFKVINDSLGHVVGDELLQAIGRRISRVADSVQPAGNGLKHATAARLGGDEFAILLEDFTVRTAATEFAHKIATVFNEPFLVAGRELHCAASIGVAFSDEEHQAPEDILRDADTAMYHAKNRGRSRLEVFDSFMRASAQSRMELEMDMRDALDRGEFRILFQPRVLLHSGAITGFEALLRWQHPARGLISPLEFVSIAEETGLIVPIGKFVLYESCRQLRRWKDRFPCSSSLKVSVNVSAKQLQDAELFGCIEGVLRETGLHAKDLSLEITESVVMEQTDTLARLLSDIRRLGVGIEIDDFGTGFCSLNYLHQFTFDAIKIDRTFVSALSEGKTEIVKTIVGLGQSLGMPVIAEGIETRDQRLRLEAMECRYGQGYLFAPPLDVTSVETLLASKMPFGPIAMAGFSFSEIAEPETLSIIP